MAIYHFHAQVMSRGDARSSVAAAAYRHRTQMALSNEEEYRQFDYREKGEDLVCEEMALPDNVPNWFRQLIDGRNAAGASEALWNAVEAHETRANGQLAREIVLALPAELSKDQNIALVRDYVREAFTSRGMVADWVYHDKEGNPHIHVMLTMAPMTEQGFGSKWAKLLDQNGDPVRKGGKIQYRSWAGDKETLKAWRSLWADIANRHLELGGHEARIDDRTYEAQGVELQPTAKIGVGTKNIVREADARGRQYNLERIDEYEASRRENLTRITRRPEIVLDVVSREKSVFDERDIAKILHRYVDNPALFSNLMARVLGSPEIVKLAVEGVDPETGEAVPARFATRDMMRLEAEMARRAEHLVSGLHRVRHGVDEGIRGDVLSQFGQLSDEQRVAIERITNDERMGVVVGRAGAGKTTMMKAAREVWEAGGYRVVGGALAGKAAEGLEKEAGIASRTLASWQLAWGRRNDAPDEKTIFVIDEAGMVACRQMADFVETVARSGGKLVLIGDADQLQPIEAGAAFRSLADRVGYAELGTIYRQREQWMRDASMDLARGDVGKAISAYQANGHVVSAPLKEQVIERLIGDWSNEYDPSKSTLILAHLRKDVRSLNELARGKLIERGLIGEGFAFRTEDGTRLFAVGEQIVFLKNDRDLGVKNGMLARVVEAGEGKIVAEIGDIGSDHKKRVEIDQRQYRNVDHGYVTTVHKAQGATVDRVKVLGTLSLDRHLTYVAMTRHRETVTLYHGSRSFEKNGGLIANLSKKGAKDTTLDYAGSELYAQALAYAESRGLYGLAVAKALLDNQRRWISEQKAKLQSFGERLVTLAGAIGRVARGHVAETNEAQKTPNEYTIPAQPWIKGIEAWAKSVKSTVEEKLQSDASLTPQWEALQRRTSHIYEHPDQAMRSMRLEELVKASDPDQTEARDGLLQTLRTEPEQFGALRGKSGLLAGKAAKEERERALQNVNGLIRNIESYVRLRAEVGDLRTVELERERDLSRVDVPALSPAAETVLARIRDAIDRNDLNAGLSFALADKMVEKELAEVASALDKRFGDRAFMASAKPEGEVFDKAAARVSETDRAKLVDAWPKFNAIQKLAAQKRVQEQKQAQAAKRDQSKDQGLTR